MLVHPDRRSVRRTASLVCAGLTIAALAWPAEASAQGFFDLFFGSFRQPSTPLPPRTQAYAEPGAPAVGIPESPGPGRSVAFCVRLCDGRYFPIQHHVAATPVQLCSALCPAAKTKVFSGGEIDRAVATDGTRYADLEHAFSYRERLVPSCTCNGKDAFGLAPVDVSVDPTLRPGDVVATNNGLMAFTGKPKRGTQSAEFTPIDRSSMSPELRSRLATMKTAPAH